MTVAYNNLLRLADLATGTEVGTWGELTDTNVCTLLAQAVAGVSNISVTTNDATDQVVTALNGQPDQARSAVLNIAGTLTVTKNFIIPNSVKLYHVYNNTSAGTIIIKPTAGTGAAIPVGTTAIIYCDGVNAYSFLASALNNYLPRSGGVLSGQLVVQNQGLFVQGTYPGGNATIFIQAYPGNNATLYFGNNSPRWLVYSDNSGETGGNAGSNFQIVALNDSGAWISSVIWCRRSDLAISLVGPVFANSSMTVSGNFTVNGTTSTINGNLGVNGNTGTNNTWINGTLYGRADGQIYVGHNTHFLGAIQVDTQVNCSSNMNAAGDVHCNATFANAGLYAGTDTDFGMFRQTSARIVNMSGNWYWGWDNASGTMIWYGGGATFWVMRKSDNLCYNNLGSVGGYGGYANFSDRRGKVNVSVSQRGLDAILQLQPVEFTRIHTPAPETPVRRELGFVAQDVMDIIPEAVVTVGVELADGSGKLDGPDPSLGIDSDAIVAAMVNAFKTLTARVAALEARHGA